jgi:hypothetical protein
MSFTLAVNIADSDSAQTFTATLDFELEFVAGFGVPQRSPSR